MPRPKQASVIAALATTSMLGYAGQAAADDKIVVELNKFEASESGTCQAFFLFRNNTKETYVSFEMSLAILDETGVIDRLLTIDAAPLNATRTALKLFEIPEIACGSISEILVHDIGSCKPQNAEEADCFGRIDLISRTDARLVF